MKKRFSMKKFAVFCVFFSLSLFSCTTSLKEKGNVGQAGIIQHSGGQSGSVQAAEEVHAFAEKRAEVSPGDYFLPLIETSDLHGNIAFIKNGQVHYRLSYIADKVRDIRGHGAGYDSKKLVLLDGGDIYQGNMLSNLQKGKCMYMAFDKMDYDAVALGNHEFDWGFENLVEKDATLPAYKAAGKTYPNLVPVVAANFYQSKAAGEKASGRSVKDYVILEKTALNSAGEGLPVKIAVIGYVCDYSTSIKTSEFVGKGFKIKTDLRPINQLARELESSGLCDATVLLMHADAQERAGKLGEDSVIDLVLGGHTHMNKAGKTSWGLSYIQPAAHGTAFCYGELKFTLDEEGRVSFSGVSKNQTIGVDDKKTTRNFAGENESDLDEEVLELTDRAIKEIKPYSEEVVGKLKTAVTKNPVKESGNRVNLKANWMCDIVRRVGNADIAFQNSGGVRAGTFTLNEKGECPVSVSDVYELFPFNNRIYVYRLTFEELMTLFEYSMTNKGSSLFACQVGIECCFREAPAMEGKVTGVPEVQSLKFNGKVIYEDGKWTPGWKEKTVTVAVNEFAATNNRVDGATGMSNPCLEWNNTTRLIDSSQIDSEGALKVLKAESKKNGGYLKVDTTPYYVKVK